MFQFVPLFCFLFLWNLHVHSPSNTDCSSTCATCSGPTSSNCTSCPSSLVFDSGRCLNSCQTSGTFNSSGVCTGCPIQCTSCLNASSNGCLSCVAQRVFDSGQCLQSCSETNTYVNNGVCMRKSPLPVAWLLGFFSLASPRLACDSSCATCNGPLATNCSSCVPPLVSYFHSRPPRMACSPSSLGSDIE